MVQAIATSADFSSTQRRPLAKGAARIAGLVKRDAADRAESIRTLGSRQALLEGSAQVDLANLDDARLVALAKKGNRNAFRTLYRRYCGEVYGFAYNQLGSSDDADDLTSETFLRVVRSLDQYREESSFRTWLYAIARNQLRDHWRKLERRPAPLTLEGCDLDRLAAKTDTDHPQLDAHDAELALDSALTVPTGHEAKRGPHPAEHKNSSPKPGSLRSSAQDSVSGADNRLVSAESEMLDSSNLSRLLLDRLPENYRRVLILRIVEGHSIRETADCMQTTPGNVKVMQHRALKRAVALAEKLSLKPEQLRTQSSKPSSSKAHQESQGLATIKDVSDEA